MSTTPHSVSPHTLIRQNGVGPIGHILLDPQSTTKLKSLAEDENIFPENILAVVLGIRDLGGIQVKTCGTDGYFVNISGQSLAQFEEDAPAYNKSQYIADKIGSFISYVPAEQFAQSSHA